MSKNKCKLKDWFDDGCTDCALKDKGKCEYDNMDEDSEEECQSCKIEWSK